MIKLNGQEKDAAGLTVTELLTGEGYPTVMVAVECNEKIISKTDFDTYRFKDGDVVEVVRFVGGGSR